VLAFDGLVDTLLQVQVWWHQRYEGFHSPGDYRWLSEDGRSCGHALVAMTVCSSNAPGLKPAQKRGGGRPGGFYLNGSQMKSVASFLQGALNKPVIDETGLPGLWDADIKWEMPKSELHSGKPDPAKVMKAAREQLGLELNLVNRRLPVLVVRTDLRGKRQ
jgi:hypothetical protein